METKFAFRFQSSSIVASSRDAESAIDTNFFAGSRSRGDFRSETNKKVAEQNVKASTLPFSAASTNAGTAVVDEDPEDDEGDAKDDGQDGPEEGGVALRKQNLQNPGSKLGKQDGSQIRTDFRGETINLCLVLEQSAMCYISSEAVRKSCLPMKRQILNTKVLLCFTKFIPDSSFPTK